MVVNKRAWNENMFTNSYENIFVLETVGGDDLQEREQPSRAEPYMAWSAICSQSRWGAILLP